MTISKTKTLLLLTLVSSIVTFSLSSRSGEKDNYPSSDFVAFGAAKLMQQIIDEMRYSYHKELVFSGKDTGSSNERVFIFRDSAHGTELYHGFLIEMKGEVVGRVLKYSFSDTLSDVHRFFKTDVNNAQNEKHHSLSKNPSKADHSNSHYSSAFYKASKNSQPSVSSRQKNFHTRQHDLAADLIKVDDSRAKSFAQKSSRKSDWESPLELPSQQLDDDLLDKSEQEDSPFAGLTLPPAIQENMRSWFVSSTFENKPKHQTEIVRYTSSPTADPSYRQSKTSGSSQSYTSSSSDSRWS